MSIDYMPWKRRQGSRSEGYDVMDVMDVVDVVPVRLNEASYYLIRLGTEMVRQILGRVQIAQRGYREGTERVFEHDNQKEKEAPSSD